MKLRLERESAAAQVESAVYLPIRFLAPTAPLPATIGERSALPGWVMVALGAASVAGMFATNTLASHDCRTRPIALALGHDQDLSITMPARTACTIVLRIGEASIRELSIDTPPRFGAVRARGRTGVIYHPNGRFMGEDSFSFSVRGRLASEEGISVIRIKATIR
jgi:hypothetical protein